MRVELDERRVALAHHWLVAMRGGEKVLAAIADLFPEAPIHTLVADRAKLSPALARRDIRTSFLQKLPRAGTAYRNLLPVLPAAAQSIDCRRFDLVVCSDASVIKGVRCAPGALKLCYCHSPMRYVWDMQGAYLSSVGPARRLGLRAVASPMRRWDRAASETVTAFAANSFEVARRISRHYGRRAVVIPPPVDVPAQPTFVAPEDFYLVVGQQTAYKRTDLAIQACNRLHRRLLVVGEGEDLPRLRRMAGPTVELLGWCDDATVQDLLHRCRGLLFCGQEDFGIVPVEAQAAGRPVIAYGAGGAVETVIDHETGILFNEQTPDAVVTAMQRFERTADRFMPQPCYENARRFSAQRFTTRFRRWVDRCTAWYRTGGVRAVREEMEATPRDAFL